jgi:hypothetical protein
LTDLKQKIIIASVFFTLGLIVGGVSIGLIFKKIYKPTPCSDTEIGDKPVIVVKPIQGKKGTITHSNWNFKNKKSVCFTTTSTGEGKIETSIDKHLIPEANKWMTYHHGLQASYSGLIFNDGIYRHVFGVDYLYRWTFVALGGGPRISYYEDKQVGKKFGGGFNILAQAWFKGI